MKKKLLFLFFFACVNLSLNAQKTIVTQLHKTIDARTGEHVVTSEFLIPVALKANSNKRIFNALKTLQGKVLNFTMAQNNILIVEHIQTFKPEELLQFFRSQNIDAKYKDPILNRFLFLNDNGKLVHE